jgi:hypothetical protein
MFIVNALFLVNIKMEPEGFSKIGTGKDTLLAVA